MNGIIILGSAMAVPDEFHENTSIALVTPNRTVLLDSPGSPLPVLLRAKINPDEISDIILTHFHPDHVSGIPVLLLDLWLTGRKKQLNIFGLDDTISRMITMLELYRWQDWPDFFSVNFVRIKEQEQQAVIDYPELRVFSSPVPHLVPGIGIRGEWLQEGFSMAYSSDTEPSDKIVTLAKDVDLLIHEATGAGPGHTSAGQAGEIAALANARQLMMIHCPTNRDEREKLVPQAKEKFTGGITLAEDLMRIEIKKKATSQ